MSPFQSAHPLPKSELLPLQPPHWPHDHCHQGIHWVLMVRHTRMQRWLSLCHLGAMVGKLLNSIPTAYVYHDKPVTYGFTLAIWGKPPTHTHRHTHSSLYLQPHLICLAVFLSLYPNRDIYKKKSDRNAGVCFDSQQCLKWKIQHSPSTWTK